ncbi:hypothetical protein [Halogeometricum pallidum]|uniref:hypothetical protein n=1 Tax=Halogeometricum pallidum TaxID=411361 RepID=UPI001267A50C|nr:hypothetical protein [Halogeometricum pallidum]
MSGVSSKLNKQRVKHDLHGEEVGRRGSFYCDFCNTKMSIEEPIMYDIARIHDMAHLELLVDLPDGWSLDAARCQNCEVEGITPETDGWEEAVVILSVNESNGVLSVDAHSLTVVDYSPGEEGECPPPVQAAFLSRQGVSMSRWGFLKSVIETTEVDVRPLQVYRDMLEELEGETD